MINPQPGNTPKLRLYRVLALLANDKWHQMRKEMADRCNIGRSVVATARVGMLILRKFNAGEDLAVEVHRANFGVLAK
jgi:hypothetical protein